MRGTHHAAPRHGAPLLSVLALIAASLLVLPTAASAGSVSSKGDRIEISASKGSNRLLIGRDGGQIRIEELNPERGLRTKGSNCTASTDDDLTRVECPATGINEVEVSTRGGNDWVVVGRSLPDSRGDRNHCRGSGIGAVLEVRLGAGRDIGELGDGSDSARGGNGHDLVMGCAGNDRIDGGADGDRVSGDRGDDELTARGGTDWVIGCRYDPDDVNYPRDEQGDDDLRGGGGNDFLYGCAGRDAFRGGDGDDDLNTRDGLDEVVDCGADDDVVYLDPVDLRPGCEVSTNCTTDNYPIGPDTGVPSCFTSSLAAFGIRRGLT